MDTLHIITLNWEGEDKLKSLYPSLIKSLDGVNYKWHIKDNGSKDKSLDYLKNLNNSNINIINYGHNKDNYSQGMNFLFKEANPKNNDLVLTLNNDIIFNDTTSIKNMMNILKKDNNVGVVGAKLNFTNTSNIQHAGVLFHRNGLPFHYRAGMPEQEIDRKNRYYPIVTGAVSMTTGDVFRNSLFCEDYHWAFDDCDFCLNILYNLNKKIIYCGQTNIFHEESAALKKNPLNKLFMNQNIKTFVLKWKKHIDTALQNKYIKDINYELYKLK